MSSVSFQEIDLKADYIALREYLDVLHNLHMTKSNTAIPEVQELIDLLYESDADSWAGDADQMKNHAWFKSKIPDDDERRMWWQSIKNQTVVNFR